MNIRLEEKNDYFDVENLLRNAFWNIYRPGAYEHYIVHNLRKHPSFIKDLAYIAEKDDKIIGCIYYSNGIINGEKVPVLGPIAIDEANQKMGYGSKLIEFTLNLAQRKGIDCIFVVGDENYYSRFGFESASKYGIYLEGTDTGDECPFFMIKVFNDFKPERGIFHNPEVFNVDENDVDDFDRRFEYKEKLVMQGQLGV